jgi:hypothetical protein
MIQNIGAKLKVKPARSADRAPAKKATRTPSKKTALAPAKKTARVAPATRRKIG